MKKTKKTSTSKKERLWLLYPAALFAGMYLGIIIGVPIVYFVLIIIA
jgi:hypothetical protein